jgi:hypothetical protein
LRDRGVDLRFEACGRRADRGASACGCADAGSDVVMGTGRDGSRYGSGSGRRPSPQLLGQGLGAGAVVFAPSGRALTSRPSDPAAATTRWAAIDRELTDQAPWVPLYNPRDLALLSARVGNYQYHPYWSLLIDQLWVR